MGGDVVPAGLVLVLEQGSGRWLAVAAVWRSPPVELVWHLTSDSSVRKNPSICKGETPRSIVYAPQEVAGHARSAKTEGQHVSDGDHRGACAQRPFPATAGCRGGLFVHSRARSPFVL